MKKRVACYCRVSTNEQSIDSQLDAIKRYCKNQNWDISNIYKDNGISGAKDDRPELNQLKKDCLNPKRGWSAVVVFRFDRMARSTQHLLECLNLFKRNNVDFTSINEGIDTSTSVGKMVFTFLAGIAEFEREIISERVKTGVARAKAEGKHCGRPRKGFDVAEAIRLHKQGWSLRRIAKEVNASYATVNRTLKSVSKTYKSESV